MSKVLKGTLLATNTYLGTTLTLSREFGYPTTEANWIAFGISLALIVGIITETNY